jgi:hypothetical protein
MGEGNELREVLDCDLGARGDGGDGEELEAEGVPLFVEGESVPQRKEEAEREEVDMGDKERNDVRS